MLLAEALASASHVDESHFEFEDLSRLAEARREQGEAWEIPEHLSRCPLCLEAFQIILEDVPAPSARAIERFVKIGEKSAASSPKIMPFPSRGKTLLKIAASIAALFGALWTFNHVVGRTSAHVSEGTVALQSGKVLPRGASIPGGVTVTATEHTSASLDDGSKLDLGKDTKVSFHKSFGGDTTIGLTDGAVVASVTKQKSGNEFVVRTPLGEVVVVGTRFSVTCQAEDVVVYQSVPGQAEVKQHKDVVRAMRVTVFEGIVRVRRHSEQVLVTANQIAVLRESEPGIEVSGERR